ncbi:MAG: GH92 family glycosyl hydrolase [Chitinophagales bacterium]|nr:GH92 family glycosyl hydrolase [Chitinophagales bacterium]
MKRLRLFLLLLFISSTLFAQFSSLVNPFIGTGGHGHTYPGASMPFGMMQLSPDTRLEGWDGCGGYHYSDSAIYGFSHTHLSGTGIADYCDILVMPFTGEVKWKNKNYASPFSHKNEQAAPGYYAVKLDKHNIQAQLSTSIRSGMHQYTFDAAATEGSILLDLQHRDEVLDASLEILNETTVKGMRRSRSWARDQVIYFYLQFDQPIQSYGVGVNDELQKNINSAGGKNIKSYFRFALKGNKQVKLRIGISGVSMENAQLNLETEIPHWDFEKVKSEADAAWNKELGRIAVKGGTREQQVAFYTALYHTMLAPNVYTDINGEYRGTDLKVYKADGFTNYSVFSLWDTHRALHPLHTLLNKQRTNDWINTFLAQYKAGGMLPVWELSGNETYCMIGYHAVPVITDAWKKGIQGFDKALALKAMTDYAESNRFGLPAYMKQGYVSNEDDHESTSKTVEYAYDDWCIAEFARMTGNEAVYKRYSQRALNYRNLFDPRVKHIRGKVQGFWYSPYDATEVNNFFTEGNSWHYSFTAQQDIDGLKKLYGGQAGFAQKLNELFTTERKLSGRDQSDVTGLIGQYAHGNEPSHHMAYLFNYAGQPWRTQEIVHRICTEFYPNNPDGLIGNEDCGQMSAWLVLSAMGFYPVTPGSDTYAIGTPLFDKIDISLENGKHIYLKAKNHKPGNFYVESMQLNGKDYTASFFRHSDLAEGAEILFTMSDKPALKRGTAEQTMPHSRIEDKNFVAVPYFDMDSYKFKTTAQVKLAHIDPAAKIYYEIRKTMPQVHSFPQYKKPFTLSQTDTVYAWAVKNGISSPRVYRVFYKVPSNISIDIKSQVHPMYTAGGKDALIDGIMGNENWKTGDWQSYYAQDFKAVIDLQSIRPVKYVGVHVLQEVSPWIVFPKELNVEYSVDGTTYLPLTTIKNRKGTDVKGPVDQELGAAVNITARYLRFTALTGGPLPAWHESAGSPSHIFIDEVIVR